jgi:hypothetical protein
LKEKEIVNLTMVVIVGCHDRRERWRDEERGGNSMVEVRLKDMYVIGACIEEGGKLMITWGMYFGCGFFFFW